MKNLMCLIFIFLSNNLLGQYLDDFYKNDVAILRDSLWFKFKLWKEANLYELDNPNPMHFDCNPSNIDFIDIPVLRFKPEAAKYDYGLNLVSFLEKDSSNVFGFLIKNGSVVGQIMGFKRNDNWKFGPVWIFSEDNFPYIAYKNLNEKTKKTIFTIAPIGLLWYNHNDSIYVIKEDSEKPVPAEILIKDYVSLETIRQDYSQGEYRKVKKYINYGRIVVEPISLDSTKVIKKVNSNKK